MTYAVDDTAKIFKYASELKARGIRLLAPDINESRSGFTPVEGAIRFGLSAIKGLGHSAVNAIIEARASKPFTSMFDLAERLSEKGGGKRVLESLVCSGAFDSLKPEDESLFAWRACLFATVDRALEIGARTRDERASGQEHLFGRVDVEVTPQLKQAEGWTQKQLLANEKAAVGFYVSAHPLQEHLEKISSLACTAVADLGTKVDPGGRVRLAGVVSEFTLRNTRKGDRYAFFRLEDLSGASVKCVLWPEALEKKGQDAANDALLLVTGKRDSTTDGMITILCDEVAKLEKVSAASAARPQTLLIEIPDDLDVSEAICQVLLQSPGDSDVLIELARRKQGLIVRARTARSLRVRSSKILNDQLTDLGVRFHWSETA